MGTHVVVDGLNVFFMAGFPCYMDRVSLNEGSGTEFVITKNKENGGQQPQWFWLKQEGSESLYIRPQCGVGSSVNSRKPGAGGVEWGCLVNRVWTSSGFWRL